MRQIKFGLSAFIVLFALSSCATNSKLTEVLSEMAVEAVNEGNVGEATILNVAANVSKAAEDITPEDEYYIGRSVAAKILETYSVYENPVQEAYVNKIAQALIKNSYAPELYNGYHVKILDSDEINAFATSGGHIFVTRGLMNCSDSEDALAAALAHEIAHIQLKHSSLTIKSSRYTSVMTKVVDPALNYTQDSELIALMNDCVNSVVKQLITSGYSKEQEFQADSYALDLMNQTGYNPHEMITLLSKMKQVYDDKEIDISKSLFSTHPLPKERIRRAKKYIKQMGRVPETLEARQIRFDKIMHS